MRSSKSRSRNKNNRNNNRSVGNVMNRVFDSSGPEGKVRGTPQQIIDKYTQLTSDAHLSNDRVAAENFQQHAEHYLRMQAVAQREQDVRREQQEKEQRERQLRSQQRADQQGDQQGARDPNPGAGDQPDLAEPQVQVQSDLVETPEATPSAPGQKRARRPRAARPDTAETPPTQDDGPAEAAE